MNALRLLTIFAVLISLPAFAERTPTPSQLEQSFWQHFADHDLNALKSMMAEDYLSVEDTIKTRDQVLQNLAQCKLNSFNLSDQHDQTISGDTRASVYRITEDGTCQDKHYSGTFVGTTVWIRRNGHWLAKLHTEHPLEQTQ